MITKEPRNTDELGPKQRAFIAERLLKPEKFDRAEQFHGVAAIVRTARVDRIAARKEAA